MVNQHLEPENCILILQLILHQLYFVLEIQFSILHFADNTLFDCREAVEPNRPNTLERRVQFVYGTNLTGGIPNTYIHVGSTDVQVTDNDGNTILGPFTVDPYGNAVAPYWTSEGFEGPVISYDPAEPPYPNAITYPISHNGDFDNDAADDVFEVKMRYWGPCNPYVEGDPFTSLANAISETSRLRLIASPPEPNAPSPDYCFGNVLPTLSASGTTGTLHWYDVSNFTNEVGTGTSYTHNRSAVGAYNYWIREIGSNGCVGPDTMVTLTINPLPLNNQAVSDPVICAGDAATITLQNSVNGVTYQLRNDANDAAVGAPKAGTGGTLNFTVSPAATITYNILATDDVTGCDNELTDKAVVTVHPLANITSQPPSRTKCEGTNATFTVTATGPGITYRWYEDPNTGTFSPVTNGGVYSGATTATLTLTNLPASMDNYRYKVELTTTGACSKFSNAGTLRVNPMPLDRPVIADEYYLCYGTSTSIVVQSSENAIAYDFRIGTDVKNTQTGNGANLDYSTGNLTADTTYNVYARNTVTGCNRLLTNKPRVIVNPDLTANLSVALPDICYDEPIDLPSVNVTGGSGTFSFDWTGTDGYTSAAQDPAAFPPASSGGHSYTVTVTDEGFLTESGGAQTCTATDNTSFTVYPLPLDRTVQVTEAKICYNTATNIRIVNSENGVQYQVRNAATDANVGGPVNGTGANITVPTGNLTATTQYKVMATRTSGGTTCEFELTDKPTVTVNNDLSIVAALTTMPSAWARSSTSVRPRQAAPRIMVSPGQDPTGSAAQPKIPAPTRRSPPVCPIPSPSPWPTISTRRPAAPARPPTMSRSTFTTRRQTALRLSIRPFA